LGKNDGPQSRTNVIPESQGLISFPATLTRDFGRFYAPLVIDSFFSSRAGCVSRLFASILVFVCLTGCPGGPGADPQPADRSEVRPLNVVVTTSMVADLVRHVAGKHAQVTALMGEGVDPHLFRPTSADIGKMMRADIVFYSGLGLEGAMQGAFERAFQSGKTVVAVTDSLPKGELRFSSQFEGHPDPHVWNDVGLWSRCLETIVDRLSQAEPAHAAEFEANAQAYRLQLKKIDDYARQSLASIPPDQRYLVTAHDAFSYFARAYGLEERSVQGITTESEPGVQDINALVDFLVQHKIPTLFVEVTVNAANLRAVVEGARQRGWNVKLADEVLFSDSMGASGTYEGTYIGMIDHNVTAITRGLGGTAPERGMQGKLSEFQP
jgi:manganese/zinc/iron transport system substrate-binding protein